MKRQRLVALTMVSGLTLIGSTPPAWSQTPIEFSDVVIFATNSIEINQNADVLSGDVIVNDASNGPTLAPGVELEIERKVIIADDVRADSIAFANQAQVLGDVECNPVDSSGVTCLGLGLPVFNPDEVPPFVEAVVRAEPPQPHDPGLGEDVATGVGGTVVLEAGFYGDITIDKGGTVVFSGGVYNIGSVMRVSSSGGPCSVDPCRSLEFLAPTELRIFGPLDIGKNGSIGPADGSGVAASDIILYVGDTNLGPSSLPPAAWIGQDSTVDANIYAGNGTLLIDKNSIVTGAFLGRDVRIDKDVQVTLDTFFAPSFFNPLPTADAQAVLTNGTEPLDITLTGSDPDDEALTFSLVSGPSLGTLTGLPQGPQDAPSEAIVTYTASQTGDLEDKFTFRVTDPAGGFDDAVVSINPVDPGEGPPQITGEVVGKDDSLEVIKDTELGVTLVGFADVADPAAVGDFTFAVISAPTNGTLDPDPPAPSVPTASDLAPPVPTDLFDSVRTAETTYLPGLGFEGTDSFVFEVCGDLDGNGDTLGTGECDTATVSITVGAFNPPNPPVAEDLSIRAPVDIPVEISLDSKPDNTPQPRSLRTQGLIADVPERVTSIHGEAKSPAKVKTALTGGREQLKAATGEPGTAPNGLEGLLSKASAKSLDDDLFFAASDRLFLSVDGGGSLSATYTVEVEKPNASASVRQAFLLAASTGFTSHVIADGEITLQGVAVNWDATVASGISSNNYRADVTTIVKPIVDAAAAGRVAFDVVETGSNTLLIDGVILAVVFDDPTQCADQTVLLLFGAQDPSGDTFAITLAPIDPAAPGAVADMGLGISFGFQGSSQANLVDVNGQRLTSAAGGHDDGVPPPQPQLLNGSLITVGGLDDSNANPTDPNAGPTGDPRSDDELYSLLPFITPSTTAIVVDTDNPSLDDNIFFASFQLSGGACPDLVVSSLTHDPASPTTADQIDFAAVVENVGSAAAGSSTLCFEIGGESCTLQPLDTLFDIPSLDPQESFTVLRTGNLATAGTFQNTAIADIEGVVAESNEDNNLAIDTYVVTDAVEVTQLTFTILSLPTFGTLFDSTGTEITVAPTVVPSATVTYQAGTAGTDSFMYQVASPSGTDTGTVAITNYDFTAVVPEACKDGRDLTVSGGSCSKNTDCCSGSCTSGTCD